MQKVFSVKHDIVTYLGESTDIWTGAWINWPLAHTTRNYT
jgi:hypothetical protein